MSRYFCLILVLFVSTAFSSFELKAESIKQMSFVDSALSHCIIEQADKNNWLLPSDVISLKCHGKGITNLDGINAFEKLTKLSLYNNKIQSADLSALHQLEHLNLANNKLQSINVKGLANLQTLYLFKNKLTTVAFDGLVKLKKIRITNNELQRLDISPLKSLEKAYFFDNKLEDLIVVGLPKLKFIELRQNPMPDEVYDRYDAIEGITIVHDGNADDWK